MGKSTKKSAPAKGKRKSKASAEEEVSKDKKQKPEVKVAPKNGHVDDTKNGLANDRTNDDFGSSSAGSDEKVPEAPAENASVAVPKEKGSLSDDSDSSEDGPSSDDGIAATKEVPTAPAKEAPNVQSGVETGSDEDIATRKASTATAKMVVLAIVENKDESNNDSDATEASKVIAAIEKGPVVAASEKGDASHDEPESHDVTSSEANVAIHEKNGPVADSKMEESDDKSSYDEVKTEATSEEPHTEKTNAIPEAVEKDTSNSNDECSVEEKLSKSLVEEEPVSEKSSLDSDDDDDDDDEHSSEEEEGRPSDNDPDVEMMEVSVAKGDFYVENTPGDPSTPKEQTGPSKTLFVGNLSFSVEQTDVEDFFRAAGEITDIRFAMHQDGSFKGFGHVEFDSAEAAEKALVELNGKELLGRHVKLDLARDRGSYARYGGRDSQSFQQSGRTWGKTVFIRGFDKHEEQSKMQSSLEEFFGGCGEIRRITLPKDLDGSLKGTAYVDFSNSDGCNKALQLNGSEFGEGSLWVQVAKRRGDNFGGGGRFGGGRGRFGGGRNGGRGYFGGRFWGGGRGRGRFGSGRGG